MTTPVRSRPGLGLVLCLLCTLLYAGACRSTGNEALENPGSPVSSPAEVRPPPVDHGFITRALHSLEPQLPKDASFLEIRVTPAQMEIQVIESQSVTSHRYREPPSAARSQLGNGVGKTDPPVQVPIVGKGKLEDNGFSASEVDLTGIARAFPVALKAVDPTDGWIREVVVRRYLPFGSAVRARIFVDSPRMSGSIDTNGNGVPLRAY